MKFKNIAGAVAALAVVGALVAAPAYATDEVIPEVVETTEVVAEVVEAAPEAVPEVVVEAPAAPVETVEEVAPVVETIVVDEFVPYDFRASFLIPESWPFNETPVVGDPRIWAGGQDWFENPDEVLTPTPIPCDRWVQADTWSIENTADEQVRFSIGPKLELINGVPEDSTIIKSHTFIAGPACEEEPEEPPVTNSCVAGVNTHSTNLADLWGNVDTRSKGHVEYVENGLHVWTEDSSSQSKVSEGIAVNFPLHDTGVLSIDVTAQAGNVYPYGPGLNLFVDITGDLVADGTLVYETVYGQDLWVTNGSAQALKDASVHTGGNGSENHGTIDHYLLTFPEATVVGLAYSLGSGVQGDWVINSITAGCATHTFDYAEVPPVEEPPVEEPPVVVPPVVNPPVVDEPIVPAGVLYRAEAPLASTGGGTVSALVPLGAALVVLLGGILTALGFVLRRRQAA